MASARMGCGRRSSRALAYSVSHRLSSSGVNAGSVVDIGYLLGLVAVSWSAWLRGGSGASTRGWRAGWNPRPGSVQQPEGAGVGHRLGAAVDAELAVQVDQVGLDRALLDEQLGRDLGVGAPRRQ